MKALFFSLALICLSCAHTFEPDPITDFIIKNTSGYDLEIRAYNGKILVDEISIKKGKNFSKRINMGYKNPDILTIFNVSTIPNTSVNIDSVAIIFNKMKIINQSCSDLSNEECIKMPKNLLFINSPENKVRNLRIWKPFKGQTYIGPFKISFDKSDYDRAVFIKK